MAACGGVGTAGLQYIGHPGAAAFFAFSGLVFTGRAHGLRYWLNDELLGNGQLGAATQVLRFRANTSGIEFVGPNFQPLTSEATTDQP